MEKPDYESILRANLPRNEKTILKLTPVYSRRWDEIMALNPNAEELGQFQKITDEMIHGDKMYQRGVETPEPLFCAVGKEQLRIARAGYEMLLKWLSGPKNGIPPKFYTLKESGSN